MSKFNIQPGDLYDTIKSSKEKGYVFQNIEDYTYNGRTVIIHNNELLHFANCGYLGLEKHPLLIEASIEALKRYGTQNSFSRAMLSSPLYKELHELLPIMFPGYHIVAPTVTLAHCAAIPALISENDAIILDAYAHNSMRMASKICQSNGTLVILSKHNDMENIRYLIYRLKKEGKRNIWYCADGIYSIHGNTCNVKGLQQLLDEEENFYAYVDDAHGVGWFGKKGSGYVISNFGLHDKMIVAVSFNKSMAAAGGGLIVPDRIVAEFISLTGQTMIFSGPIQPPSLGALTASVKFHSSDELIKYQNDLADNITYFRDRSSELSLSFVTTAQTPIQLLRIGNQEDTINVLSKLIKRGFFASAALYPAIEKGDEGIRISLTRHLSRDDINSLLINLKEILDGEGLTI